jgi:hypothetical protein
LLCFRSMVISKLSRYSESSVARFLRRRSKQQIEKLQPWSNENEGWWWKLSMHLCPAGFFQDCHNNWGGWHMYPISVVETQCVKAGALRDTINWLKMTNAYIVFLVLWDKFQQFFLNCGVSNWKLISTRHEFNSNNFIFTALKLWWEDWVSKLNSRLSLRP